MKLSHIRHLCNLTTCHLCTHPVQYVFKKLKVCYYIRYNDDFVILGLNRKIVYEQAEKARQFAAKKLSLEIPKEKAVFRKLKWGIDFCGSIVLPNAILLRQKTKRGMLKKMSIASQKFEKEKLSIDDFAKKYNSYLGLMKNRNCYNLKNKVTNEFLYEKLF